MTVPPQFDPDYIYDQLSRLSSIHAVAFAASCCERMLPNYRRFQDQVGWGDTILLRTALDQAWQVVSAGNIPREYLRSLVEQCDHVTPDTEVFTTSLVSHALDASAAISETLELCVDGDLSHALRVATSSRDTVDMYIQKLEDLQPEDSQFEEKILNHPLMVREWKNQVDTLQALAGHVLPDSEVSKVLHLQFKGMSSID